MLDLSHPEQFAGPLAIYEPSLRSITSSLASMDWQAHLAAHGDDKRQPVTPRRAEGKIAVLDVVGPLSKYGSSIAPTSTLELRQALRHLGRNEAVAGVMLFVESPGGTTMGTDDLAAAVADVSKLKPTHAYIEDLGASAAYWIAAQASAITANRSAMVGSIGTYAVVRDYSRADEARGVTTHIVRAGRFKGVGEPGAAMSAEDLAEMQRVVTDINSQFISAVASGRRMNPKSVEAVADGRIHLAADAKRLGLIDAVGSFDDALAKLRAAVKSPSSPRSTNPIAKWNAAVKSAGSVSKAVAQNPELHRQYLANYNTQHRSPHDARRNRA